MQRSGAPAARFNDLLSFENTIRFFITCILLEQLMLEAISKIGFWVKIEAAARFKPEEYSSISRIYGPHLNLNSTGHPAMLGTERPTKSLGQKTFLR